MGGLRIQLLPSSLTVGWPSRNQLVNDHSLQKYFVYKTIDPTAQPPVLLSLHASLTCISISAWPLGAPDSPCSSLQT